MRLTIISGGQTGVDQVALELAHQFGFPTGGTAPHGYRTDEGPNLALRDIYGLKESSFVGYRIRTASNVRDSDSTVWFGVASPGFGCTHSACLGIGRPFYENPTSLALLEILRCPPIRVLNVAGNRRRTHPDSAALARLVLTAVFQALCGEAR